MKRTINLSNTQFRYQLVFFIHIYGCIWLYSWLKVAFGIFCLGKTCGGIFCLGKKCRRDLLTGGMFYLLQRMALLPCHSRTTITFAYRHKQLSYKYNLRPLHLCGGRSTFVIGCPHLTTSVQHSK